MEHLKGASLGQALALPTNIRLGWKGSAWTNALAFYEVVTYGCKKFYNIGPWSSFLEPSLEVKRYGSSGSRSFWLMPSAPESLLVAVPALWSSSRSKSKNTTDAFNSGSGILIPDVNFAPAEHCLV